MVFVVIQKCDQMIDLVVRGHGRRFPSLAFVHFTIACNDIGVITFLIEPARKRHTDPHRKPLPQRTRGSLDPGQFATIRMSLERAAEFTEIFEGFRIKIANFGQGSIKSG